MCCYATMWNINVGILMMICIKQVLWLTEIHVVVWCLTNVVKLNRVPIDAYCIHIVASCKLHQISAACKVLIATVNAFIGVAIFQSNPSRNAGVINECGVGQFRRFGPKIGFNSNVLERSENEGQFVCRQSYFYQSWKFLWKSIW